MRKLIIKFRWYAASFLHIFDDKGYCHQEERDIMRKYYTRCSDETLPSGVIVMVDGRRELQGGLTDRLRGIASVFSYCEEKGIPFFLHFTHPFRLEKYLRPNEVDWRISESDICYDACRAKVCLLNNTEIPGIYHRLCLERWVGDSKRWTGRDGRQLHIYTNSDSGDKDFRRCFHRLFKPGVQLQEAIDYHKGRIGGRYISISYRFTTLLGDFKDTVNTPLSAGEQKTLIAKCLEAVSAIASSAPSHDRILVTADSEKFLREVARLPRVYVIPGSVGHFDHGSDEETEMKTFIDYLMIAGAEAVYLARSGKMYRSGFAGHAAMIGGKPFREFVF